MITDSFATTYQPFVIHFKQDGGDFQQSVGLAIKPASLDIDYHGEETAKAVCHYYFVCHLDVRLEQVLVENDAHCVAYAESGEL